SARRPSAGARPWQVRTLLGGWTSPAALSSCTCSFFRRARRKADLEGIFLARIAHLPPFGGADVACRAFASPPGRAAGPFAGGPPGPRSAAAAAARPEGRTLPAATA